MEKDIYENIDRLKLAGFDNISIDLIYALPGQTMEQVKENVAKAIGLDIPHMSLYSLILENHTVFMNRMRRGKLPLPKEELEAEMFEYIIAELERAGFEHYEISNFSKPGFESRHNLMYWDNAEYYGIGAGASGYVNGVRYKNHGPIRHYLSAVEEGNACITEDHLSQRSKWKKKCSWDSARNPGFPWRDLRKNLDSLLLDFMEKLSEIWFNKASCRLRVTTFA